MNAFECHDGTPLSALALDGGGDRSGPLCVDTQIEAERNGGIAGKARVGKALLTVAIVQAQLHAPHLPVGDAVGRPGGKTDAIARVLGQVGQVLQAYALAFFAVT